MKERWKSYLFYTVIPVIKGISILYTPLWHNTSLYGLNDQITVFDGTKESTFTNSMDAKSPVSSDVYLCPSTLVRDRDEKKEVLDFGKVLRGLYSLSNVPQCKSRLVI